jgi:hypothetical protein
MKKLTQTLILIFLSLALYGQRVPAWEWGLYMGSSNYGGDLIESKIPKPNESKIATGMMLKYNLTRGLAFRSALMYGSISGSDHNNSTHEGRMTRNLSFRSPIYEYSLAVEFSIIHYDPLSIVANDLCPYLVGGIAVYHFNPQAFYEGQWIDLQPLGTEGQGMPGMQGKYGLTQVSLLYGIGIKQYVGNHWNISIEFSPRKTFTDYLDDVSGPYVCSKELAIHNGVVAAKLADRSSEVCDGPTRSQQKLSRGNPEKNDYYIFTGISISKNFGRKYTSYFYH